MNIYRGCSHGCIYCDSRSSCYQFDHSFEDIEVKINAPVLLEKALQNKRNRFMIMTGSMSDPYLHIEEDLKLTRSCLEVILKYGFGVSLLTKSDRILRDIDLLEKINRRSRCIVSMTLTTYDDHLCKIIEPNVCTTRSRIKVLEQMKDRGIETLVWLSPILPFINDDEDNIRSLINECIRVGVKGIVCFGMGLTLREGNREYYYAALDRHFPGLKEKYISLYGDSYNVLSLKHRKLMELFGKMCKDNGIIYDPEECFRYMEQFPEQLQQTSLF